MGDFIKELTIIDFLGMLVPGSLLVLLFDQNYHLQSIWNTYFPENTTADTVILLIMGYTVGMLIHEIGDFVERGLWKCMLFNPRYYAAKKVFGDDKKIYASLLSSGEQAQEGRQAPQAEQAPQGQSSNQGEDQKKGTQKRRGILNVIKEIIQNAWPIPLVMSILLVLIMVLIPVHYLQWSWIGVPIIFLIAAGVIIIIIAAVIGIVKEAIRSKNVFLKIDTDIEKKVHENAAIQTELVGKGNESKRRMFDGFYVMMRNLLLVIAITNLYVLFTGTSSALGSRVATFYQDATRFLIYIFVCIIMLVRCYYYAYLKYKYSYEDYLLYQKEQREKRDSANESL